MRDVVSNFSTEVAIVKMGEKTAEGVGGSIDRDGI